jgi:cysteine-rich repeat protein
MRTVSCSTGYGGTATSITCGSNLAWSSSSGCTTVCGDSRKYGSEGCDDGNTNSMDGCSSSCAVEAGYTCSGGTTSTRDTCVDTNDCSGNTCRSGSTCSDLRPPNNGYDCVCTNSRANEVLRWPSSGATTNDRVNLPSSTYFVDGATKTALTISLWMQSSDTEYALLSYNVANQDNTILLWYDNTDGLQLWLNNAYRVLHSPSATYRVNDNMWHMLTVTWLSSSGAIDVWIDGVRRYQYTGFQTGFAIPTSGGHMVLGQEQDSVNGGYVLSQGYVGYMAQFYLWTSVLTNDQIATLYLGTAAPNVAIAYCDVVGLVFILFIIFFISFYYYFFRNVAGGITFVLQRDANMCVDSVMYWNGASTTNRVDIVANTFFPNSNTCDWTFSGWFKFTGSGKVH